MNPQFSIKCGSVWGGANRRAIVSIPGPELSEETVTILSRLKDLGLTSITFQRNFVRDHTVALDDALRTLGGGRVAESKK